MPPIITPKSVRKQRYLIVAGECWFPVKITATAGGTDVDIDAEIAGEPVTRTGAATGVVMGQGTGARITHTISGGIVSFTGGGGGPAAVEVTAIIMFPAEESS